MSSARVDRKIAGKIEHHHRCQMRCISDDHDNAFFDLMLGGLHSAGDSTVSLPVLLDEVACEWAGLLRLADR